MHLRLATSDDATWINERYASVHFQPSDLSRDLVVIAELDAIPVGLGRLVPAGPDACELGGILVFEEYRRRGIARSIVEELLRHAGEREVYCIPFAELEPIYAAAGFVTREAVGELPEYIRQKLDWCEREIPERPVVLMQWVRL